LSEGWSPEDSCQLSFHSIQMMMKRSRNMEPDNSRMDLTRAAPVTGTTAFEGYARCWTDEVERSNGSDNRQCIYVGSNRLAIQSAQLGHPRFSSTVCFRSADARRLEQNNDFQARYRSRRPSMNNSPNAQLLTPTPSST
jgi:hypothetical protein